MISDNARAGMQQAPARSLFNALGFTPEEMKKPMVGIVSSFNEIVPGHMNIDKIVEAVKLGVAEAGGVPVVFPAIAVCDGIAMGHVGMKYSLVTRDLIADSTECMAIAHQFDALVMVPNCDKNVPGLLMAAARLNLPTVFVSGGPMLAGHVKGRKRSLSSMFEAVGSYAAGTMTEDDGNYTIFRNIPNPKAMEDIVDYSRENGYSLNFSVNMKLYKDILVFKGVYGMNQENVRRSTFIPSDVYFARMYKSRGNIFSQRRQTQQIVLITCMPFHKKK